MSKIDVLRSEQELFARHMLPRPDALLLLLRNTDVRQRLLSHPTIAGTLVVEAEQRSGLSCAEIEDRLAAFIDAEAHETTALTTHQAVALHIHSCPWCYDIYALTLDVLAAQKDGTLPHWPQ